MANLSSSVIALGCVSVSLSPPAASGQYTPSRIRKTSLASVCLLAILLGMFATLLLLTHVHGFKTFKRFAARDDRRCFG